MNILDRSQHVEKLIASGLLLLILFHGVRIALLKSPLENVAPTLAKTAVPAAVLQKKETNAPPTGMPARREPELPPATQAVIDRIVASEILGQIIRPQPMALLGIAGQHAFIRAPNGQTGLIQAGEELGGIKLLQVGTNRVLVEQAGEKKELIIFSGLGSASLLPTGKEH